MVANESQIYLKYAQLQMAAEALLDIVSSVGFEKALTTGNTHASRFTPVQAAQFVKNWKVVEHISNTSTGFSASLFECLVDDPARGLVKGEQVMSFRSTEFVDDEIRDIQATNAFRLLTPTGHQALRGGHRQAPSFMPCCTRQ